MVASYVAQWCDEVDEVWLSLSPLNPMKAGKQDIVSDLDRLAMLRTAAGNATGLRVIDTELSMPRPSYTVDTLRRLASLHPDRNFRWIIGSDNWKIFRQWKDAGEILERFGLIIYPRPGYETGEIDPDEFPTVTVVAPPVTDISSTWIRNAINSGKDVNFFLPPGVYSYIVKHNLYT